MVSGDFCWWLQCINMMTSCHSLLDDLVGCFDGFVFLLHLLLMMMMMMMMLMMMMMMMMMTMMMTIMMMTMIMMMTTTMYCKKK